MRGQVGENEDMALDASMRSIEQSGFQDTMSPFNIRIDTPKIELTDGQRRRIAATSRIRVSATVRSMYKKNNTNYLFQALQNTLRNRGKVKDRFSLISKAGDIKTLSEMELETDRDKDEEDNNFEKSRLLHKGIGLTSDDGSKIINSGLNGNSSILSTTSSKGSTKSKKTIGK